MATPPKSIIAKLSLGKLGSLSLQIMLRKNNVIIFNTDEDPSLRMESCSIINLYGINNKLINSTISVFCSICSFR